MRDRCNCARDKNYLNYGARGIKVCDEWEKDFMAFYNWAMSSGYKKGLSLDRIDVNGNYEPSNCRWATAREQALNRRETVYLTYKGEEKPLMVWCDELGLKYRTCFARMKYYTNYDTPEKILFG